MKRNIVLFGPAEAGKSTLGGYLVTKFNPKCNFKNFDLKRKKELGNNYRIDGRLAYILDQTKDERTRQFFEKGGTTIYSQTRRIWINNLEALIIDTPGHKPWYRERTKGMYYGDIGVFVIDLKRLNEDLLDSKNIKTLQLFFTPLFLWKEFKDKKRHPIIIISKMDQFDFSEKKFYEALEIIKHVCRDESVEAIPISISPKELHSHNIDTLSEKLQWYQGPTLSEKLIEITNELPPSEIDENLFISIDKKYNKEGIGNVLRGKVLQGKLEVGTPIKIMPMKCNNEIFTNCLAIVKNIYKEKYKKIENAKKGSIIEIDIHDIRIEGKRCDKGKFNIIRTSCIVDPNANFFSGNILQFFVPVDEKENFHLLETVMILWFGRFISSKVVHINDNGLITLELDNLQACLPLHEYFTFHCEKFMLKIDDKFIKASKEKIGIPYTLTLFVNTSEFDDKIVNKFNNFRCDVFENRIKFYSEGNYVDIIKLIKKISKKYNKFYHLPSDFEIEIEEAKI